MRPRNNSDGPISAPLANHVLLCGSVWPARIKTSSHRSLTSARRPCVMQQSARVLVNTCGECVVHTHTST